VNSFTKVNNSVMEYINTVAFKENNYGYGAALGWIYFAIIFVIILFVMFLFRRMDNPYTREGR
jgi:ABC-type sugar transport system permease subunit